MINLVEKIISLLSKKKIRFVIFNSSTSIGMASEMLHLWCIKSKYENIFIVPIVVKVPFPFLFTEYWYPSKIYNLESNNIYKLPILFIVILNYYLGISKLILALLFKITNNTKFNFIHFINAYDVYHNKIDCKNISNYKKLKDSFKEAPEVFLPTPISKIMKKDLQLAGIPDNAKFICLHIRTSLFYSETSKNSRDADPKNYYTCIDYLIQLGYYVIRVGDTGNVMEHYENELFIDYPNTIYKSEWMDLYLIKNACLFIGTLSGILDTAYLFKKNVITVNSSSFDLRYSNKYSISLIKHIYSNVEHKYLTINEILNQYNMILENDLNKIVFYDNTAYEILEIVKLYLNNNFYAIPKFRKLFLNKRILSLAENQKYSYFYFSIRFSQNDIAWND